MTLFDLLVKKISLLYCLICLLGVPSILLAQGDQHLLDSLELRLSKDLPYEEEFDVLVELASLLQFVEEGKARGLMDKAESLAGQQQRLDLQAQVQLLRTQYPYRKGDLEAYLKESTAVYELIQGKGIDQQEASSLTNMAIANQEMGNIAEALEYAHRSIDLDSNPKSNLRNYNLLGNLYNQISDSDKAIQSLLKAQTAAKEINHRLGQAVIASNLGNTYRALEEYDKALESFRTAVSIHDEMGNEQGKFYGIFGEANLYAGLDSFPQALEKGKQALAIANKTGNPQHRCIVLGLLGDVYLRIEEFDLAESHVQQALKLNETQLQDLFRKTIHTGLLAEINMHKGRWRQAIDQINEAIQLSKKHGFSDQEVSVLETLIRIQTSQGLFEQATKSYRQLTDARKSLRDQQDRQKSMALELTYNVAEKEKEIQLLAVRKDAEIAAQRTRVRFYSILFVIALILVISLLYFLRQLNKQKQQLEIKNKMIIVQQKELQALDQLKSRLFANVSHELRTPLSLILGPLASALKAPNLQKKTATFLKLAQQNGEKLLQLINEILDLSKMDAGKLDLIEKPVAILSFVRRLLSQFESHAQDKEVNLVFGSEVPQEFQLLLDAKKFEIVFNNLLSNAIKFTPNGGVVNISLSKQQGIFSLRVHDTGPGIHPDDQTYIFDRFYQATHTETSVGGTGIGLALCKEYSKLFQGDIQVNSQLGKGAEFIFSFPVKESHERIETEDIQLPEVVPQAILDQHPPTQLNQGYHILLVEDNYSLRSYIRAVLGDHFQITTAEHGQAALKILTQLDSSIDLIISDLMMPIMDGFQLLEHLKAKEEWRSIPTIMLTAKATMRDKLQALRIGVDDYMTKPFDEEELIIRVKNLLRNVESRHVISESDKEEQYEETVHPQSSQAISEPPPVSEEDQVWLTSLEAVAKRNMGDFQFNIDALAHELAFSRRQLHRKVKEITGLTPNQYVTEIRMQEVRYLLETNQINSVKAAAYEIGMKDVKYFSRQFRERFGKLPSSYFVGSS
ncbi:MAG: tetratricopeptide repeat protein [Bacteroidota bacterium]